MESLAQILTALGYTEKESHVYLMTLELGMAPISVIARRAKMRRSTTYEILKKLSEKGVAEFFVKKNTRYYSVIPPKLLHEKHEFSLKKFTESLPQFTALSHDIVHRPRIHFYEGKEDLKRLYLDVQSAKSEILNYFLPEKVFQYFSEEWFREAALGGRVRKKIRARVIMPDTPLSRSLLRTSTEDLRTARIIQGANSLLKNEIFIYDQKMSVFSFDEDFAFMIESKDVVESQRVIFELAWTSAHLMQSAS